MTIGQFSESANLSRDTIRYYISEGILAPDKGTRYIFNKDCFEDLKMYQDSRRFGISHMDTLRMLRVRRVLGTSDLLFRSFYRRLLKERMEQLAAERDEWQAVLGTL